MSPASLAFKSKTVTNLTFQTFFLSFSLSLSLSTTTTTTVSSGMMEGAFFVGRKVILDWINEFLALNLGRIEETCSGAVACQLCDSLYPGKVNMSKVRWDAKAGKSTKN